MPAHRLVILNDHEALTKVLKRSIYFVWIISDTVFFLQDTVISKTEKRKKAMCENNLHTDGVYTLKLMLKY
jgi:hypothetical protein